MSSCAQKNNKIQVGAAQTALYAHLLAGKNIGIVANQTSTINNTHIIDSLLSLDFSIRKVFAPEHGFRGKSDAGELVKDGIDTRTGIPIVSLYGKNKKQNLKLVQKEQLFMYLF